MKKIYIFLSAITVLLICAHFITFANEEYTWDAVSPVYAESNIDEPANNVYVWQPLVDLQWELNENLLRGVENKWAIVLSTENTNIPVNTAVNLNIKIFFNQPTDNTEVIIDVPKNLSYVSHVYGKINDEDPILTSDIVNNNWWKLIKFKIKDGTVGEFNIWVSVKFASRNSFYGEEAEVSIKLLYDWDDVANESVTYIQSTEQKITIFDFDFEMSKNSSKSVKNHRAIFIPQIYIQWKKVWLDIPVPEEIEIEDVSCGEWCSYAWDDDLHSLNIEYTASNDYKNISFTMLYTGNETGDFVALDPITVRWIEWGKDLKIYTWSNMRVKVVDGSYAAEAIIKSHGTKNTFLAKNVGGPLYMFTPIRNNWTMDIEDLSIELIPPEEISISSIQIPWQYWWTWGWDKVEIEYDTNMQSGLSLTALRLWDIQVFSWEDLFLSEWEKITRIVLNIKDFKAWDEFSKVWSDASVWYWEEFTLYGDVSWYDRNWEEIQEWTVLETKLNITINGSLYESKILKNRWTSIPVATYNGNYTQWTFVDNRVQYTYGDTLKKVIRIWNTRASAWNWWTALDPILYLVVDNNLILDTDLSNWDIWSGIEILSITDISSDLFWDIWDAKMFKVETEAVIPPEDMSVIIKVPFKVKDGAIPWTYNTENSILLEFKQWIYHFMWKDIYGILWPVNENYITVFSRFNNPYTIVWSSYGMSSRIRSSFDHNWKDYTDWDVSTLSHITDYASSTYRQIFYNETSYDMYDLNITIPLPQKNDKNNSERSWILSWEVVVSWANANVTYSSDGVNYQQYSSITNLSSIKFIKLNISTWPAKSQLIVDTDILATWYTNDWQIAKIVSEWSLWGKDFLSPAQAMVYHPAPKATITYSPSTPTTWGVVATISFDQENVEITNNSWSIDYLFTQSWEFLYEWRSMRNITWTTLAKVDWIIPEPTTPTLPKHTVTFVDEDGVTVLKSATEYDYETPASDIIRPSDPIKKWYKFTWWIPSITAVTWDVVYKAIYKKDWWRWWRSWAEHPDSDCEWDCECKWDCDNPNPEHGSPEEERDMHKWAYDNWLTIYKPWEDAKFDQPLTRQQMAKISSIFWAKFIGQKADDSEWKVYECSQYKDLHKSKWEMRWYVIQSCLMKNMWYEYDNIRYIPKFKPYNKLTLAQASIIISRMAWWDKYVISPKKWYQWHMYAAYDHGLIDDISDPHREISRREAFLMLYRLSLLMNSDK